MIVQISKIWFYVSIFYIFKGHVLQKMNDEHWLYSLIELVEKKSPDSFGTGHQCPLQGIALS